MLLYNYDNKCLNNWLPSATFFKTCNTGLSGLAWSQSKAKEWGEVM